MNNKDIKAMEGHIWNYVVNKKEFDAPEYVSYFTFLKVPTFCFNGSFAHSWHSLNQLQELATRNGFPTVLKEFPRITEHVLVAFPSLCSSILIKHIPNCINWVYARLLGKPGQLTQCSVTLFLGQIALEVHSLELYSRSFILLKNRWWSH